VTPDRPIEFIGQESTGSNHNDWVNYPTVATWRNNLGMVLQALGELEGARAQYEQALVIGEEAPAPTTEPWPRQPEQRASKPSDGRLLKVGPRLSRVAAASGPRSKTA
jgi:hypothetical protein